MFNPILIYSINDISLQLCVMYLFSHDVHGLHEAAGHEAMVSGQSNSLLQWYSQSTPVIQKLFK